MVTPSRRLLVSAMLATASGRQVLGQAPLAAAPPAPPPAGACPRCCFEIIDDRGCAGSFDCNTCPMGAHGLVNVKADFGAVGNYGIDDTVPIQKAINFCKKTSRGLYFPPGAYAVTSPLDFGAWNGIHVEGGVPGANGIAGSGATVQINAQLNRTYGACFDFSGSAYGKVSGIAFGGTNCQVMALNARTCCQNKQDENRSSGSIYGSDIIYESCNFAGGSVAAFANHMGEVLTWRDCKFHNGGNRPGLLISWRLDAPPWSVMPMHGRNFTHGVTLTMFRMYGGEMTADNSPNIVLDMGGCDPGTGCGAGQGGATFSSFGTYFAQSGDFMAAIQIRGNWNNVIMEGNRAEFIASPTDPAGCQFLNLHNATLNNFLLSTYGDGDAVHNIISGTGDLNGGTVTGSGNVNIVGNIHGVTIHTASQMNLTVDGSVYATAIRPTRDWKSAGSGGYGGIIGGSAPDGFGELNITGQMEVDDGGGGPLVHRSLGPDSFTIGPQVSLLASYAGSSLGLVCAHPEVEAKPDYTEPSHHVLFAGNATICTKTTEIKLPGSKGELNWHCNSTPGGCIITAIGVPNSIFSVRKLA